MGKPDSGLRPRPERPADTGERLEERLLLRAGALRAAVDDAVGARRATLLADADLLADAAYTMYDLRAALAREAGEPAATFDELHERIQRRVDAGELLAAVDRAPAGDDGTREGERQGTHVPNVCLTCGKPLQYAGSAPDELRLTCTAGHKWLLRRAATSAGEFGDPNGPGWQRGRIMRDPTADLATMDCCGFTYEAVHTCGDGKLRCPLCEPRGYIVERPAAPAGDALREAETMLRSAWETLTLALHADTEPLDEQKRRIVRARSDIEVAQRKIGALAAPEAGSADG